MGLTRMTDHYSRNAPPGDRRRSARYLQRPASPPLAPYVSCLWAVAGPLPGERPRIRVLPDACMDLILDPDGGLARPGDRARFAPSVFLTGATLDPMVVPLPAGARLAGVRFRPGGAAAFLKLNAGEHAGASLDLADAFPGLARLVASHAGQVSDARTMLDILEILLVERLPRVPGVDPLAGRAFSLLARPGPPGRVERAAWDLGLGQRRFERRLKALTGLSPVQAGRTLRFVAAVRALGARPNLPLTALAQDLGFADQAHFTREFKALSGVSPTAWLAEAASVEFVQYTPAPLV